MRKYASVFALYTRSTVFYTLGVTLLSCAAQFLLLWLHMRSAAPAVPESAVPGSGAGIALLISFLLLTAVLCLPGATPGTANTLKRLQIGERGTFMMHAGVCAVAYLFFWAAQIAVYTGFCLYFIKTRPSLAGEQALFLASFRSNLFHSLLPLRDTALWVRNALFIVTLSLVCAETPWLARRRMYSFTGVPAAALVCVFFVRGLDDRMKLAPAVMLLIAVCGKLIYDFYMSGGDDA